MTTPTPFEIHPPTHDDIETATRKVQAAILTAVLTEIESITQEGSGTTAGHSWGNVALGCRSFFNLTNAE